MTESIEEIAGKHLGKTSDGATMMRYETPTQIDPSLLVGIPRSLNRVAYGIVNESFDSLSYDLWNCYEFSYLKQGNNPVNGRLHIAYPAFSPNIVESKSLKLYLNSFNLAQIPRDVDPCNIVQHDLANVLNISKQSVTVVFKEAHSQIEYNKHMIEYATHLESELANSNILIDNLNKEDPNLLEVYDRGWAEKQSFYSTSLRSNCRVTNQPDWGDVYISFSSNYSLSPLSLYKYIVSLRSENHFHEEIAECIYKRITDIVKPKKLMVACMYTRRGGIDINPVRVSDDTILRAHGVDTFSLDRNGTYPLYRSPRQ